MPGPSERETIPTFEVSGSAPPMPSIWRGSGEPMMRSRKASRSARPCGRASARKEPPLDVLPPIHMQRPPSDIFEPHLLELRAHAVNVEPELARGEAAALL